jgi:hypothetical protein
MQNNIIFRYFLSILFVFFSSAKVCLQENDDRSVVTGIRQTYESFNYEDTDKLLNLALQHIKNYDNSEKMTIYKYAAFRQYQLGNLAETKNYFWKIFEIDPSYNLDQITTSPKILAVFRQTKLDFTQNLNLEYDQVQQKFDKRDKPWRSFVFPGWEQMHLGYRSKGIIFSVGAVATFSGLLYSVVDSRLKYNTYMDATNPSDIARKYNSYNSAYKNQFYWAYSFIAIWLSSHIDATFFCPTQKSDMSIYYKNQNTVLSINFPF